MLTSKDYHGTSLSNWAGLLRPGMLQLCSSPEYILEDSTVKAPKRYEAESMMVTPSRDSDSICILILPLLPDFPIWDASTEAANPVVEGRSGDSR